MQKKVTSFDNTKINYDIKKISPRFLIFIHGVGGNLTAWKKEREFFHKKGISTLALDLRGHGLSDRPTKNTDYKIENFAKDIFCVLNKEKIDDFIVIGHCFGGVVATMFYKLYPNKSQSYIFIATTYKAPEKLSELFQKNYFLTSILNMLMEREDLRKKHFAHVNYKKYRNTGDWNLKRIYADIRSTSFKSWLFTFENLAKFDGVKILKSINKPVLIIEGEKDSVFPAPVAKKLEKIIKTAKLDLVPNANHVIVMDKPEEVAIKIYDFLEGKGKL